MLMEGVPPAMIENTAKMAGMPVGPLSLSDEVALDLVLKIMKRRKPISAPTPSTRRRRSSWSRWSRNRAASGARTARAFMIIPRRARPEEPVVGAVRAAAKASRSRYARRRGIEAALSRGAGGGSRAHRGGSRHHRHARGRCRLDPGLRFAPFTGGTLSYIDFMGTKNFVALCHKLEAKYGSRFTPPKLLEEWPPRARLFTAASRRRNWRRRNANLLSLPTSWPGIAVRRTASLPLAYARHPRLAFWRQTKTWMPGTRPIKRPERLRCPHLDTCAETASQRPFCRAQTSV